MNDLDAMGITGQSIPVAALMLLGYQRSKQISPRARRAWEAGDRSVLEAEARSRGAAIFRGALAEVFEEYKPLRRALIMAGRNPGHVIDIGCGQALNDALLYKDFGCAITLIDIEETPAQYHNWNDAGSGYASLDAARGFLLENGVPEVVTINPPRQPETPKNPRGDLGTSLISCGFHYPVGDYLELFLDTVKSGGAVVLDLRNRYLRKPDPALARLLAETRQTAIEGFEKKAQRTMFHG